MIEKKKSKNCFVDGPISATFIGESIAKHQSKTEIGAHDIFLGQVRADVLTSGIISGIEYSAYEEMANQVLNEIRESAFVKFKLTCAHIHHSIGLVKAGEICLFVFTSSAHRADCMNATRFIVEEIKTNAPVFGKEMVGELEHQWKVNK